MHLSSRITYPVRLFLWLLGYSVVMMGCFVLFQYYREKEFKVEEMDLRLQLINAYILSELEDGREMSAISLDGVSQFDDLRVSVVTDKGDVVYDNTLDPIYRTNHLDREEIRQALYGVSGHAVRRHSESTGESYFYSARRGKDGYIVRTAVPYSLSLDSLLEADYGFLWVMGAVTSVMCVLGYFATRRVGLHIQRLGRFAENVENGIIISDTDPFPHDELGEISNHIVRLYARLQQANAERDSEHRIAMYEQLEKERVKKQLTNNINHELKTPVASIRLCVETMLAHEDMDSERRQSFLKRCLSNAERLERMLADVSMIARMDEGGEAIVRESVDLARIICDVVDDRGHIAADRGISLRNSVKGPLLMTGNRALLESVFCNLVDNALAYSGGSVVDISLDHLAEGKICVTVADNGNGVPDEHLDRLFERFYRVDTGRSRAQGGTGLGLAIVKNAVVLHGGSIYAMNLQSGGLAFRITFSVIS